LLRRSQPGVPGNPHRAGPDENLIAAIFEAIRLPADFPVDWAQANAAR